MNCDVRVYINEVYRTPPKYPVVKWKTLAALTRTFVGSNPTGVIHIGVSALVTDIVGSIPATPTTIQFENIKCSLWILHFLH